jgi:hypothetical protein
MDLLRIALVVPLSLLGVFVGRDRQALLDQRPTDDPRLHPQHRPRGVGHREILSSTLEIASLRLLRPWLALPPAWADQLPCQFQTRPITRPSAITSYSSAPVFRSSTIPLAS